MEKIINCKAIQEEKILRVSNEVSKINEKLKLVVIQVGNDSASDIYVKNKKIVCEKIGILFEHKKYDFISQDDLVSAISSLNEDNSVTGIIVQLPLPDYLNEDVIINSISPLKDVDGLTDFSVSKLVGNKKTLIPCTALGVMEILKWLDVNLESANVVIVGRSRLVGRPLSNLFLNSNSTVTICHSKTLNLKSITKTADILVVAIGKKEFIDESYVKDGAIVIDVGINRYDNKIYGDCNFDSILPKCKAITPVPGGVGVLTVTMLVSNVLNAYYLQKEN